MDNRIPEIANLLDPPGGKRLWYGGATALGALRGVPPEMAAWKPGPKRHSIWDLTLHVAYWKYSVRRLLEDSARGSFPRTPSNWPTPPELPDPVRWKQDRDLLRSEHKRLNEAIRGFDPARLDERAEGSKTYRYVDLMLGIVTHDVYHVGQIQLLKRLYDAGRGE